MTERKRHLAALALALALGLGGSGRAAVGDGLARVTSYFCPPNCGLTAYSGSVPVPGVTAGCARQHLGAYVTLVQAGITLYCGKRLPAKAGSFPANS